MRCAVVVGILLVILMAGCGGPEEIQETDTRTVRVARAVEMTVDDQRQADAFAVYHDVRNLSFTRSGVLEMVHVEEGDLVEAGTLLAELSPTGSETELAAARADEEAARAQWIQASDLFAYAEAQFADTEALYAVGAVSLAALDGAALNRDTAHSAAVAAAAQMKKASDYRSYLEKETRIQWIAADHPVRIVRVIASPGEVIGAGIPVISVAEPGMFLEMHLYGEDLDQIGPETIFSDREGGKYRLIEVGENPDPMTLAYTITLETEQIARIGSRVDLFWTTGSLSGVSMPLSAVLKDSEGTFVYRVSGDRVERVGVMVLSLLDSHVLLEGIEPGDQIVVEGQSYVRSGDEVMVIGSGGEDGE